MRTDVIAHLVVSAVLLVLTVQGFAQESAQPPDNQRIVFVATGKGVQIYTCQSIAGAPQWVFQAPEAKLFDMSGKEIGSHGAGPVWKGEDGSLVKGKLVATSNAAKPGDIPWLLLASDGHDGTGVMSAVEYIRRSGTHGGVAPGGGCESGNVGTLARVPYSATYTFYASKH